MGPRGTASGVEVLVVVEVAGVAGAAGAAASGEVTLLVAASGGVAGVPSMAA